MNPEEYNERIFRLEEQVNSLAKELTDLRNRNNLIESKINGILDHLYWNSQQESFNNDLTSELPKKFK